MKLLLALAIFVVALGVALLRWSPLAPADGGPETFSAFRARGVQEAITKPGPRPMGSPNAAAARDFLLERLRVDGYEAHVERSFACGRHGSCGFVENVVGRRGPRDRGAVLLSAHYDSVPAAPGASDDGVGVAAVAESARAIAIGDPGRPIIVVYTDGEESGLLGAEAFARMHTGEIFAVINCDARGTTGPSMMFETSGEPAFVVPLFASAASRPVASSLFAEVYKRMPNDTDFTVLKSLGRGINIANLSGVTRYHTPLDSLENADPATLQHHGETMLAAARAFARTGEVAPVGDLVWFDVMTLFLVRWPAPYTSFIAVIGFVLVLGQTIRKRAVGLGLAAGLVALLAAAATTYGLGWVLVMGGAAPVPWVAHPLPALMSLYCAGIGAGLAVAFAAFRKSRAEVRWAGTWLLWGALGIVLARMAPGLSFLFSVPVLVAGLAGFLPPTAATIVPAAVAAILWMPLAQPLYEAIGLFVPAADSLPATILVSTLVPLVHEAKLRWGLVPATIAAISALAATLVPPFSVEAPQRVDVIFAQEGTSAYLGVSAAWGPTSWGATPRDMLAKLGPARDGRIVPWGANIPNARFPAAELAEPIATGIRASIENGKHVAHATLVSPRHASTLAIELPPGREISIRIHGQLATRRGDLLFLRAIPPEGIDVELEASGADPVDLKLHDVTSGVPVSAAALVQARPPTAVPSQEGDITVVTTHLSM